MKNFHQVSLFFSTSSHRDSLHPLSIALCIAAASALVVPLLSKAAAVASVSSLFLLNIHAPPPTPYNLRTIAPKGGSRGGSTQSTPVAPSPATIQVPSTFTPDQNVQIFQLALLKAQTDLQKAQADRDAIQARSQLELECLRRESDARVVAAASAASGGEGQAQRPRAQTGREEEDTQEPIEFDDPPASYLSLTPGSTIVKRLAWYGLAPGTRKGYCSAIDSFESFYMLRQRPAWPAAVDMLEE